MKTTTNLNSKLPFQIKLNPADNPQQESITLTYPDGQEVRFRLQDYEQVFAIPGLYEEVVQQQLRCASPKRVASDLLKESVRVGVAAHELRVLDLGAGNGISGQELKRVGIDLLVGFDNLKVAQQAAERDRPGLCTEYVVGDVASPGLITSLVHHYRLNAIACAGALGDIPSDGFLYAWEAFGQGALLSACILDIPDEANQLLQHFKSTGRFSITSYERFRHRDSMAGKPIYNLSLLASKVGL